MIDNKLIESAKEVYDLVCSALDSRGWHYEELKDKMLVRFSVKTDEGEDILFTFIVDIENQLLLLYSPLPFLVMDHEEDFVQAICQTNYRLADGRFVTDFSDGASAFHMSCCFRQNLIGEEVVSYLIDFSYVVIKKYRSKLRDICDGKIKLKKYLKFLYE